MPSFVKWICNPKTNMTFENWKATDGEVGSYVYGRGSVEVSYDQSSTAGVWMYNISRRDPTASGYWRVPVTLAVDISEKDVEDVEIVTGDEVLRISDGSLRDLKGARIMEVGYDVRGTTLYVSHFWNESSVLKVSVRGLFNPRFIDEPKSSGLAWQDFRSWLNATEPDNGSSTWELLESPEWLSVLENNGTSCLLGGYPTVPGTYHVSMRVSDSNNSETLSWSITILWIKTVRGIVKDSDGFPLADTTVMIAFTDGDGIRSVEYSETDELGLYELSFGQEDWASGDRIEVSATVNRVTAANDTLADNFPYQEIDLTFRAGRSIDQTLLVIGLWAAVVGGAAVAIFVVWQRSRKR
jgi:hypothetical protein